MNEFKALSAFIVSSSDLLFAWRRTEPL
jgi:hypothetical protein